MRVSPSPLPLVLPAAIAAAVLACGRAPAVPLSSTGQGVEAAKGPPPVGSRNLGPVDASHGSGCGLLGIPGSYDGALAELRNRAADVGGNYVQIESVTGPHEESGCTTAAYAIHGVVFLVPRATGPAPVEAPEPPRPGVCDPPCSPGFACKAGACAPVCNPPCEAGEVCTRRRTCEPAGAAPVATASASASPIPVAPAVLDAGPVLADARPE